MFEKPSIIVLDGIVKGHVRLNNSAKVGMVVLIVILILFKLGSFLIHPIFKPIYRFFLFFRCHLWKSRFQSFVIMQSENEMALFNPLLYNSNNFCLIAVEWQVFQRIKVCILRCFTSIPMIDSPLDCRPFSR